MQLRTKLIIAAFAIGGAACKQVDRDRDQTDPTTTAKPTETPKPTEPAPEPAPEPALETEPAPTVASVDPTTEPTTEPTIVLLEKESLAAKYKDCITFV